jgi:hypothetical protein
MINTGAVLGLFLSDSLERRDDQEFLFHALAYLQALTFLSLPRVCVLGIHPRSSSTRVCALFTTAARTAGLSAQTNKLAFCFDKRGILLYLSPEFKPHRGFT